MFDNPLKIPEPVRKINLLKVNTSCLAKYGHHIRVVRNIKERNHIMIWIISGTSELSQLSIDMVATPEFYANVSDLLRLNNTSLLSLEVSQPPCLMAPFFTPNAFIRYYVKYRTNI
ncbi:MAG: hypothetical protein J3Q66DRAFT_394302 [Benniella sp.]|nr:MAG: hypothetical protein J3Q66DRAFT_394302 [Benniella sp.]